MASLKSIFILTALLLSTTSLLGFSPQPHQQNSVGKTFSSSGSSALHYIRDRASEPAIATPKPNITIQKSRVLTTTKPKVREIKSLDELQYFLEEDDRPVAIK